MVFVEVVADHQHVQMFFQSVDGERPRRVGRGWQHMFLAADLDDIGGMSAASTFGVKGVDCSAFHGGDGVFDKAAFVQRIGVDHHLHVHGIGHGQAAINGAGRSAPVFVQLQSTGARVHLFFQSCRKRGITLARNGKVHCEGICGLKHAFDMPWTGRTGGCQRAMRGSRSAAQHGGQPRMKSVIDLLRADEMDVAVKPASRQDAPLARNRLGSGADDDVDAGLSVGVARLADLVDAPVFQAHIRFVDT